MYSHGKFIKLFELSSVSHVDFVKFRLIRKRAAPSLAPPLKDYSAESWFYAAAGSAPFACSTIALKASGSRIARSERTLRSISILARARPSMKRE